MKIFSFDYPIFIGNDSLKELSPFIKTKKYTKAFILVDELTCKHVLPVIGKYSDILVGADIIETESGEQHKNFESCIKIWEKLTKYGADRKSLLINAGGGVICDMGGFAAATFKRGIDFINIPTTLLAQVDASIGGKIGIDLNVIKNQIGLYVNSQGVFIYPDFLKTLNNKQLLSGFVEIIKHSLIADEDYWDEIQDADLTNIPVLENLILQSIKIKKQIILADPFEKKGLRKSLNFGHTIGHAIESYSLKNDKDALLHGESVAIGLICETYLSHKKTGLSKKELNNITKFIKTKFKKYNLVKADKQLLVDLAKNDKKNENGAINFTLIDSIGSSVINQHCSNEDIIDALNFYIDM